MKLDNSKSLEVYAYVDFFLGTGTNIQQLMTQVPQNLAAVI